MCHLRIEKEKYFHFRERFSQSLSKYLPGENKIRKNNNSEDLLNTASIFNPKFGKLLRGIWKIKSLASNLNLCLLNQPTKSQIPEVKAFHLKGKKARLSWNMVALEFTEAVVHRCFSK